MAVVCVQPVFVYIRQKSRFRQADLTLKVTSCTTYRLAPDRQVCGVVVGYAGIVNASCR